MSRYRDKGNYHVISTVYIFESSQDTSGYASFLGYGPFPSGGLAYHQHTCLCFSCYSTVVRYTHIPLPNDPPEQTGISAIISAAYICPQKPQSSIFLLLNTPSPAFVWVLGTCVLSQQTCKQVDRQRQADGQPASQTSREAGISIL